MYKILLKSIAVLIRFRKYFHVFAKTCIERLPNAYIYMFRTDIPALLFAQILLYVFIITHFQSTALFSTEVPMFGRYSLQCFLR